jgi:DNA-binding MarR family transcriptional regulator
VSAGANKLSYSEQLSHWLLVSEIHQKCQRVLQRDLRLIDLNLAQHDVLVAVKYHPGLTQRELADVLYVVKSNVTSLVQKLEQRRLLVRAPDPHDGRSIRLTLTRSGDELAQKSLKIQRRVVSAMMGSVSSDEMAALEVAMRRAGAALDAL